MTRPSDPAIGEDAACARVSERLAAWADGGLAPEEASEIERHVEGCARCAEEARAVQGTLSLLHALPAAPERTRGPARDEDPRFWMDFERNVRLAYDARVEKRRLLHRSIRWIFGLAAATAAILIAVEVWPGGGSGAPGEAPRIVASGNPAGDAATPEPTPPRDVPRDVIARPETNNTDPAADPLGVPGLDDPDLDPDEIIEHLGADDLQRVQAALGGGA